MKSICTERPAGLPADEPAVEAPHRPPNSLRVVTLPQGLVGFPDARHFSLGMLGDLDRPFMLLRSADRFALSFVVLPLASGGSAGSPPLRTSDACERLGINADDLAVLLIVTLRPGSIGTAATVNLRAPLLIDTRRQLGWQIVQENPALPVRLPLQPGA